MAKKSLTYWSPRVVIFTQLGAGHFKSNDVFHAVQVIRYTFGALIDVEILLVKGPFRWAV